MLRLILLIFSLGNFPSYAQDTTQYVIEGRTNHISQQNKPYVILISADGFRHDYAKKYNAVNLHALSKTGVQAKSMIPSFPSLTYPSHYSIITGMYAAHHGIVNNDFYDPQRKDAYGLANRKKVEDGSWYGGIPLWVLAEQQQMLTASFYYVASEANIKGIFPTYYYRYNEKISIDKRIQVVANWLKLPAERRPHLISFYFPEVDHEGHVYGPDAPETANAVRVLDSSVYKLVQAVKTTGLPVSFVFVSDHGMTNVDKINTLKLPAEIDTSKFIIPSDGILISMHAKDESDVEKTYKLLKEKEHHYKVYLKSNAPKHLHFSDKDDKFNRIGDIILIPTWPKVFNIKNKKVNPGWHGYDATLVNDMHAAFLAWGPAFKKKQIPSFENIHVYPLLADMLGLKYYHEIDGKQKVLKKILK